MGASMKLIIQIPCFNEAGTLAIALAKLPRQVEGFTSVEWLVIDDGSVDGTADVARSNGVDHVVRHTVNRGLAAAFMTGLSACLKMDADVIVNTDADNQFNAGDIPKLVQPIIEGRSEFVIGARPISNISHFSPIKKFLQILGSYAMRLLSGTSVADAPSGFRAITRRVAKSLFVHSQYTYTLDTIIQAGCKNIDITSVPISVNKDLRPSRLVKSIGSYVMKSIGTMIFIFIMYRPLKFFLVVGSFFFIPGFLLGIRFLVFFVSGSGQGKTQSLILASLLLTISVLLLCLGIIAELIACNRRVLEDIRAKQLD
jgi:glycosyltransferase involved in cell wall biosynthesis